MPAQRPVRPTSRARVTAPTLNAPAGVGRAIAEVTDAVRRVEAQVRDGAVVTFDLVVGDNTVTHDLGRAPAGASVSPTVADVTFAWAMTSANESTAVIEVLNVAQPGAGVRFW